MARYRKVYPLIWSDRKFRTLSADEQLVAIYCLTCENSNRIGIFKLPAVLAADDLRLDLDTYAIRVARVCDTLGWQWDSIARVIYIPSWWKWNAPENPKVLIGALKDLDEVPETPLLTAFKSNVTHLPAGLRDTFRKRIGEPIGYQEQQQEQDRSSTEASHAELGGINRPANTPVASDAAHAAATKIADTTGIALLASKSEDIRRIEALVVAHGASATEAALLDATRRTITGRGAIAWAETKLARQQAKNRQPGAFPTQSSAQEQRLLAMRQHISGGIE